MTQITYSLTAREIMTDLIVRNPDGDIVELYHARNVNGGMIRCPTPDDIITAQLIECDAPVKHEVYQTHYHKVIVSEGYPASFTDLYHVRYDNHSRLYNCSNVDMRIIIQHLGGYGNQDCAAVPTFAYPKIDDHGLLDACLEAEHTVVSNDKRSCKLINLKRFNDKWLNAHDLIFHMYPIESIVVLGYQGDSQYRDYHFFYHNTRQVMSIKSEQPLHKII